MTHEFFREQLPLYVTGALDGQELRDFEAYVAANRSRCDAEIRDFQAVADQLALAAPPAEPSKDVFKRIKAAVENKPAPEPSGTPAEREVFWLRWIPWTAACALAVLLIMAAWGWAKQSNNAQQAKQQAQKASEENDKLKKQVADASAKNEQQAAEFRDKETALRKFNDELTHERDGLRQQSAQQTLKVDELQRNFDRQRSLLEALADPAIHVGQLSDPNGKTPATAKVYWMESQQKGLVIVSKLSPVVAGGKQALELWLICENQPPTRAGLFWTDENGQGVGEIKLAKQVACIAKFAISLEPAGGVDSPTGPIVLAGQ